MKILKIVASNVPLFEEKVEIDFMALQRVTTDNSEKMSCIFSNGGQEFWQNNVTSFIGINASGKTSILRLITFVFKMLNNEPLNRDDCSRIFDGLKEGAVASFDTYFYSSKGSVNYLHTDILRRNNRLVIDEEYLKSKDISKVKFKKTALDFKQSVAILKRDKNEEFLLDDVSIMVAFNKRNDEKICFTDMLKYTNINQLNTDNEFPLELIEFFDPSIEYLKIKRDNSDMDICLKFKKSNDEIILNQAADLNRYLSSGTIKGINTFINAIKVFKTGGYLIVDELENHFNREIVSTLVRFFMDNKVNPLGANLIFSTHYSELLDEFERNDNIYVVRNRKGITIENLSRILKRNDIKKSEAYQSDFLEGTVPMYDSYMGLKKKLMHSQKEDV